MPTPRGLTSKTAVLSSATKASVFSRSRRSSRPGVSLPASDGKAAKYEAFYPDNRQEVLLDIPEYDFNWQSTYQFKEMKFVPAGTKLILTTVFDNSAQNEFNPNPDEDVRYGEPTTAEMSFGWMSYIAADAGGK